MLPLIKYPPFEPTFAESERFWNHELPKARRAGRGQLQCACPIHGGDNQTALSVNVEMGTAYCHTHCRKGWGIYSWVCERYHLEGDAAWEYIYSIIGRVQPAHSNGWPLGLRAPYEITDDAFALQTLAESIMKRANLLSEQQTQLRRKVDPNTPAIRFEPVAIYPYAAINAVKVRYQHERTKSMSWFQMTEKKGWKWKLNGAAAGPYRAERLSRGGIVIIANGEKAVDRIDAAGWPATATCIPNGEQSRWTEALNPHFKLAERVYVPMDNDPAGNAFGHEAAGALAAAGIEAYYLEIPGEPKSDVWDFIEGGGTWEEFLKLTEKAVKGSPEHYARVLKGRAPSSKITPISGPPLPPGNGDDGSPAPPPAEPPSGGVEGPDLRNYELTDTGNAERLFQVTGDNSLYIASRKRWIHFDAATGLWRIDTENDGVMAARAVETMRLTELQSDPGSTLAKYAHNCRNVPKLSNMLRRAAQDPAHHIAITAFDASADLIPHQGGVFDLATGENRKARREDFIIRVYPFRYDPALPEPKAYLETLYRLMGWSDDLGDSQCELVHERVSYLQRAYGYSLTGHAGEKVFFVAHGEHPHCGKTLLLKVLTNIMGDGVYAEIINPEILCRHSDISDSNKQAELARTCGARIMVAAEPDRDSKLNETLLRQLTQGGQRVTAAYKYENPFSFVPTAKLWVEANKLPGFNPADHAFAVRPHIIHHGVQIPPEERDSYLMEKLLRTEGDQIFSWMVKGGVEWKKEGLRPPPEMGQSLAMLRAENIEADELDPFLEKHFDRGPGLSCWFQEVLDLYYQWCRDQRTEARFRHKTLGPRLEVRDGITRSRTHAKAPWRVHGLCPKERPFKPATGKDAAVPKEED